MSFSSEDLFAELLSWMDTPDTARSAETISQWEDADVGVMQKLTYMQGVSPYLHDRLPDTPLYALLPASLRDYLANEYEMNAARQQRIHRELAAILADANRAGIEVIPLKGALLTTHYLPRPAIRPMADIDLLVRPEARQAMATIMLARGYQFEPEGIFSHSDKFIHPGDHVVRWDGEHPQNPCPVEVHISLTRLLWANLRSPDLTASFWDSARPVEILGQRAYKPSVSALYSYMALHALTHFVIKTGRLAHWLDLAFLAASVPDFGALPYPDSLYPPTCQAARALPGVFQGVSLAPLAVRACPLIRRWAEQVPLDGRCGLIHLRINRPYSKQRQRWERWRPNLIRLTLAYGQTPLPVAFGRYLLSVSAHLRARAAWRRASHAD